MCKIEKTYMLYDLEGNILETTENYELAVLLQRYKFKDSKIIETEL